MSFLQYSIICNDAEIDRAEHLKFIFHSVMSVAYIATLQKEASDFRISVKYLQWSFAEYVEFMSI